MIYTNPNKEIFFDLSVELLIVINAEANVEEINDSWKSLGYSAEDMVGRPYREFVYSEDREITQKEGEFVLKSGTPSYAFENRIQAKDGSFRWISWASRGYKGFMYAAGRDITEQKIREEKYARVQEQLYAFIKQSPAAIALFDKNFTLLEFSNRFWEELQNLGTARSGELTLDKVLPLSPEHLTGILQNFNNSKNYTLKELRVPVKGQNFYLELQFTPWYGSKSELGGGICFLRNNTAKIEAQNQIQQQDQMLRSILENLPVVIFKIDKDGRFVKCTGAGLSNKGLKEEDIVGHKVESFFQLGDSNLLALKSNSEVLAEIQINGEICFFQTYFSYDSTNNDYIGIALDVSDKMRVMKDLENAKVAAERANFAKSRFLANMSHEMRTPLNLILGFADLLHKKDSLSDQDKFITYIQSSGQTLLKLIEDILDLSKIEQGKVALEEKRVHFKQAVTNSLLPYKYKANEKGLNFSLQFDEFIPEYLLMDYDKIHQVLLNLVSNAIKFTKEGGITVSFSAEASFASGTEILLKFSVSDTGIGIPPEKQDEVFNSFVQADSSISRNYGGTGLGLSIAKQLVNLLGGELKVISPSNFPELAGGVGSIFYFSLKLLVVKGEPVAGSDSKGIKLTFQKRYRVLVAEDNFMNQKLADVILQGFGCEVTFASNGQEALDLLNKVPFDIVLMDIQMPLLDGIEATKALRQTNIEIPVIGLTAHVHKDEVELFKQIGMNDYLGKPYSREQLYKMMGRYLEK